MKTARLLLIATAVLAIAAAFVWQYGLLGSREAGRTGTAAIGGPFTLVDQTGKTRHDSDFRGKLMLIYFGYTFCPDVCPTALQVMTVTLESLGDEADAVQPLLITIDPARDTPVRLKSYVANFYPGFMGLTGSPEAIAAAAGAYKVYFARAKPQEGAADRGENYLMDHSSIIFLMGRDGRYLTHFSHSTDPAAMADAIRRYL